MKRHGYSLLGLFGVLLMAVAFLPMIRKTFARSFPEGFQAMMGSGPAGFPPMGSGPEGFQSMMGSGVDSRKGDCKGVTCNEGEFCQENVCRPVMAPITNDYFPDK